MGIDPATRPHVFTHSHTLTTELTSLVLGQLTFGLG